MRLPGFNFLADTLGQESQKKELTEKRNKDRINQADKIIQDKIDQDEIDLAIISRESGTAAGSLLPLPDNHFEDLFSSSESLSFDDSSPSYDQEASDPLEEDENRSLDFVDLLNGGDNMSDPVLRCFFPLVLAPSASHLFVSSS